MASTSKHRSEQAIYLGNLSACFTRSIRVLPGRCAGLFGTLLACVFLLTARWLVAKRSPRTQPVKGALRRYAMAQAPPLTVCDLGGLCSAYHYPRRMRKTPEAPCNASGVPCLVMTSAARLDRCPRLPSSGGRCPSRGLGQRRSSTASLARRHR